MEECISTRTRSSLTSNSINNWKICDNNFKIPRRAASVISYSAKYKKEIISVIKNEIGDSIKKYRTSIHELNYLQSGNVFIFYKKLQTDDDRKDISNSKSENAYEISKKYFIDDSDDSDPEYIDSDELINRVIAERCILNRVEELQKNNLWSLKMINKKSDPTRPIFHWDLLIKEMKWLQDNMSTNKQSRKVDAKKLAVAACKYVKEKEAQMIKNNKEETIRAKKHCINISKIVKEWWKQMQKIVLAKQKFRLDARRQEAINDHLGKVIETTQKYTEWLTEDLKLVTSADNETSTEEDPEFQAKDEWTDDEETIDKEEMETDYNVDEEIQELKKQNDMSLEDILKELPWDYFKPVSEINNNEKERDVVENVVSNSNVEEMQTDSENHSNKDAPIDNMVLGDDDDEASDDWEETMIEQEQYEEIHDTEQNKLEIDHLKEDADIPMDELLELYREMYSSEEANKEKRTFEKVNIGENLDESGSSSDISDSNESIYSNYTTSSYESSVDLGTVFNVTVSDNNNRESLQFQGQFKEISEVAMSTQPRGFTLESTDVKVQVPFLLKHSLREYQHVGLDWMAAIYEKRLNGVLADEMGLGKTIQTIALLAYLSCEKGIWGPHLVVVPTSVVLNWEIEFKKWCPGFKILTYFGSMKERKEKRKGWTKTNAFHVCITSYKLAIQDSQAFKRKKWKYIILDEAQNIKNFKSQRWQTLLTFNSQRRLLLTGTPLQNNLMELWSLMHFLMPHIFQSHREFNEWFGSPLSGMIEGSNEYNEQLVMRLHKVLRPFILRRLKKDVEKQMPQKFEHLIMCPLSKRQRFLYDDYMSLASTKEMLSSGQFMSIINILMQLRKVCNHPNLFEDRPTVSPFSMIQDPIDYYYPKILFIEDIYDNRMSNGKYVRPAGTSALADLALNLPKFVTERILGLMARPNLIEEVDNIHVTDWVSKFGEKFTDSPLHNSFIPRDLIDYLNKSDVFEQNKISLPNPLMYGLKIKKIANSAKSSLPSDIILNRRKERVTRLRAIIKRNFLRCSQYVSVGLDMIDALTIIDHNYSSLSNVINLNILKKRTLEEFLNDNMEIVDKITFVTPAVIARGVRINTPSRPLIQFENKSEQWYTQSTCSIPVCLSRIRQNQLVQFPDTRLIEYDCGKLQILVPMLKRLKSEGHRCLIFTQMTRMLDVLEQFLSYHGYRYLRLDGTTKIEQRQIMMEQFNKDERIFVFILSTRSGGIGVNLTGADTVIFYDSDWNPTMDAQAQDRCHRIGQTRDVHIYRLISRMTIEENILKKANEKRCLNEMAIEGGQFNMSFFKSNTLQDIFQTPSGLESLKSVDEETNHIKVYKTIRGRTIHWKGDNSIINTRVNENMDTQEKVIDPTQFEAALEEVEDESDRLAAKITRAEAKADLVEFDETVPWDDNEECSGKNENEENKFRLEMEFQLQHFNAQLNPLQKYGVNWIEQSCENMLCSQIELEETQIESNKQTWELEHIKALHEDEEEIKNMEEDDMLYIYGSYDPYAAQKEELEKLRKEEELQQLLDLRKEEEMLKIEKDKAAAQAWAQEQHRNALKRKSEVNIEADSSENTTNREFPKSSKKRKVIIPRMEFPNESITTVKTINTFIDEVDQPLVSSSSSSVINDKPFSTRKKIGRSPWKNVSQRSSSDWNYSPKIPDSQVSMKNTNFSRKNNSFTHKEASCNIVEQSKALPRRHFSEFNQKEKTSDIIKKDDCEYNPSQRSFTKSNRTSGDSSKNTTEISNNFSPREFSHPRQTGRFSLKNISINKSKSPNNKETPSTYQTSKELEDHSDNIDKKQIHFNRSPDENIAPYSKEIFYSSVLSSPFKTGRNVTSENKMNMMIENEYDDYVSSPIPSVSNSKSIAFDDTFKKKRGRPSIADIKKKALHYETLKRDRNCSESTNSNAVLNKKNSFKIPVKTLNGEHKLFSAPLLLLKTKPVFVITRKIEDKDGNVYTQNLTYPIDCNEKFNTIANKLSSFASTSSGK